MKKAILFLTLAAMMTSCKKSSYPSKISGKYSGYKVCQTTSPTQVFYDTSYMAVTVDQIDADNAAFVDSSTNQYITALSRPAHVSYPYFFANNDSTYTAYFDSTGHHVWMTIMGNCVFSGTR